MLADAVEAGVALSYIRCLVFGLRNVSGLMAKRSLLAGTYRVLVGAIIVQSSSALAFKRSVLSILF